MFTYSHNRIDVPNVIGTQILYHRDDGVCSRNARVARPLLLSHKRDMKLYNGDSGERASYQSVGTFSGSDDLDLRQSVDERGD